MPVFDVTATTTTQYTFRNVVAESEDEAKELIESNYPHSIRYNGEGPGHELCMAGIHSNELEDVVCDEVEINNDGEFEVIDIVEE